MDTMRAFLEGFRKAWSDDSPPIDELFLRLSGEHHGTATYSGPELRAPFHRGIILERYYRSADQQNGGRAAVSLAHLLGDHVAAVDVMRAISERADLEARAAGGRLVRYLPVAYHHDGMSPVVEVDCDVELIDDGLARRAMRFRLDNLPSTHGWRQLRRELREQRRRAEQSGRGQEVDPVLAWHLAAMPETHALRLADLLARDPVPQGEDMGSAFNPHWDRSRLSRHGISLPGGIDSIRLVSGILEGKVRLGPTLTWNKGRLTTTESIPATVSSALAGRPLTALANHPSLPDLTVMSATLQRNGLTVVKVDLSDAYLPFPSCLGSVR